MNRLTPGTAPDHLFVDKAGRQIQLSDLWSGAGKGLLLVFLRHFSCLFCKAQIGDLKAHYQQIRDAGYDVAAVGQGSEARAARFAEDNHLPFPVFGDKQRETYNAYGLTSDRFGSFLVPDAYRAGIKALMGGYLPGMPEGSLTQNPGVFLIDRDGRILRERIGQHAGDFATIPEIMGWIEQAGSDS
jgi:peroxiredoxin